MPLNYLEKLNGGGKPRRCYSSWSWAPKQAITCEMCKYEFNNHFFTRAVREAKAREFMDLIHGGMTVTEYASRFVQLSRFATYLILDVKKKAKKFKRGLNPRIRTMMAYFDIQNLYQLVDHASIYEERLKENMTAIVEHKKRSLVPKTTSSGRMGTGKRMVVGAQKF